jgi:hypothetical protein
LSDTDTLPKANGHDGQTYALWMICLSLAAFILWVDMTIALGVAIDVLYVLVIWISLWNPKAAFTVSMAVLCSILTVGAMFFQPFVPDMWKVVFNRALGLFAIWVTAVLGLERKKSETQREQAIREREKALAETRVLRGLLPICSSCKKIRDDQGYWIQMEGYIRDHSEAEFSHGLCPECVAKLYPDLGKRTCKPDVNVKKTKTDHDAERRGT